MDNILERPFAIIDSHIKSGKIPGATIGIVSKQGAKHVQFCGFAQTQFQSSRERLVKRETIFDLASLTKPIYTTTAIMKLVASGKIALDDPLSKFIPDLRQYDLSAEERSLTIEQCLTHSSFLPAVEPIYTHGLDPLTTRAYVLQRDWKHGPSVYSDINFILLGIVLERVFGTPLITHYTPNGTTFSPEPSECAATEFCTWRNRVICGEVHDENAYSMGGASGHAGLFGSIDNVLDFAKDLLNNVHLPVDFTNMLFERRTSQRSLGWEIKYDNWPGGKKCSDNTIGHTGFTGTGLWIDPVRGIAWALLTNRVHPSRHTDSGIIQLRRDVGNSIIENYDKAKNF